MEINQILKNTLAEDVFVDQHEMVCRKTETCQLFTDKMELISFDGGHLTKEGALYWADTLSKSYFKEFIGFSYFGLLKFFPKVKASWVGPSLRSISSLFFAS